MVLKLMSMSETTHESFGISPKPQETILPIEDMALITAIEQALKAENVSELETIAAANPRNPFCWAALSISSLDKLNDITSYAYARIGYHRGLDLLRANGWRGSGYVRSNELGNRGFLVCLALLKQLAQRINEEDETQRCGEFLTQLDPSYDWNSFNDKNPIDFMFQG